MTDSASAIEVVGIGAATLDDFWLIEDFSAEERVCAAYANCRAGGGPVATALCVLAHHGHACTLVDIQGGDATGELVRNDLQRWGVCVDYLQQKTDVTSALASVWVRKKDGARQIAYMPSNAGEPKWTDREKRLLSQARLLHLNGRHEATGREAVKCAKESGVTISFDGGAGRYRDSLRDLVLASHIRIVARDFARLFSGSDDLDEMIRALSEPPAQWVVITDGVRGSHVAIAGQPSAYHQQAYPAVPLVDTTGCGDVYHGAFLHGWLQGWEAPACAKFASRLAAKNAEGLGGRFCLTSPNPLVKHNSALSS